MLRGKVVWLSEALERLYGVSTEPDAAETTVAIETDAGHLQPIVPDTRGQSFVVDGRLRDIALELPVRRYQGVSWVQVIRVLSRRADGLYEIDYWCDICAIPMYILKPCECCQGASRLREQLVEEERWTPRGEALVPPGRGKIFRRSVMHDSAYRSDGMTPETSELGD